MGALDWIALSYAQGLGPLGLWQLVKKYNSPEQVFETPPEVFEQDAGMRKSQVQDLRNRDKLYGLAEIELQKLQRLGGYAIDPDSSYYPTLLKQIPDPPPVLYLLGNKEILQQDCLAIVGSRASSAYGRRIASLFASDCVGQGFCIVSGLALGIDAAAHEGALLAGGKTVGVLGCGLDIVYPPQNRGLTEQIREKGAIISEYPLGTRPDAFRFPARNRIIAGMSYGVLVVEATQNSGSLITAQMGVDFGREIFAVPGQVDSPKSTGSHCLLQQGAKLVQRGEDIWEELRMVAPVQAKGKGVQTSKQQQLPFAEFVSDPILDILDVYPISRDELIEKLQILPKDLAHRLLLLELDEKIELLPGDMVRKL